MDDESRGEDGKVIESERYRARLAELDAFHEQSLQREAEFRRTRRHYQSIGRNGAMRAFEDYAEASGQCRRVEPRRLQ